METKTKKNEDLVLNDGKKLLGTIATEFNKADDLDSLKRIVDTLDFLENELGYIKRTLQGEMEDYEQLKSKL